MKIGIIAAMRKELDLLLLLVKEVKEETIDGTTYYSGTIGNHQVTMMQCGIGKVNAALGTIAMLNNYSLELVINSGVAGGADKSVNVMDVVVCETVAYHDIWCGPGTDYGVASGYPKFFEAPKEIVALATEGNNPQIRKGLICSGDQFIASIEEVNHIKGNFPAALAVDMESASIAQTCYMRNVPFFSIRVISDSPGANHDNAAQYENFWEIAQNQTFSIIEELLNKLK